MSRYFLVYDLNGKEKDYAAIKEKLKEVCNFVARRQFSFFLVDFEGSVDQFYQAVVSVVDEDDSIIVIGEGKVLQNLPDNDNPTNLATTQFITW